MIVLSNFVNIPKGGDVFANIIWGQVSRIVWIKNFYVVAVMLDVVFYTHVQTVIPMAVIDIIVLILIVVIIIEVLVPVFIPNIFYRSTY